MSIRSTVERHWRVFQQGNGFSIFLLLTPLLWFVSICMHIQTSYARRQSRSIRKGSAPASIPVISIGNLAVGGTGKTPLTIALAKEFQKQQNRIGIVSSGYGRESGETITFAGRDFRKFSSASVGDEVLLMASELPDADFAVAQKKSVGVAHLQKEKQCSLILVDDGFQHWSLRRDVDLVTLKAPISKREWRQFPLGGLREADRALVDADIIVWTKLTTAVDTKKERERIAPLTRQTIPDFRAEEQLSIVDAREEPISLTAIQSRRPLLFAGVGDFESLQSQMKQLSVPLAGAVEFADHQHYHETTYRQINDRATQVDADCLLTTQKDMVKIDRTKFRLECYTLKLDLMIRPSMTALANAIEHVIQTRSRNVISR